MSRNQVQKLQDHVTRLIVALQHVDLNTQSDRIALNASQAQLRNIRQIYAISKAARARAENDLHEKRQKHSICRVILSREQKLHQETRKSLNCVWRTHTRLSEILYKLSFHDEYRTTNQSSEHLDVRDLMLKLETKANKIAKLEIFLKKMRSKTISNNFENQVR